MTQQDLSQALATARRALAILERQAAGYTSLEIPTHLQIQLEDKRAEVAELEAQLRGADVPGNASTTRPDVTLNNAQAGIVGDHTHVEGGIHFNINLLQKEAPAISPGTPEWGAAIARYRQRIREHYGVTRVLGKHEPVSLEGIYTDVYLLDDPKASFQQEGIRGKRLPGEAAVLKTYDLGDPNRHRFVILGKPGGGKTTFLKHIALSVDCPIFITLREWERSGKDLRAFIAEEMVICGLNDIIAETWLNEGQAVLLLDGLDEISEETQRRLDLDRFIRRYPKCRILVTCRMGANPRQFEHFKYVEVADFTDEQVEAFAERWFDDGHSADFYAEIKQNPHIRDLSRTPLLLGMLCLTYEKRGGFPEKRAELYQKALDALLVEWDESRGIERDAMRRADIYHQLSLGRKHQMFARIAYETFEQGESLIPQERLEQRLLDYLVTVPGAPERIDIDAKAVLKAVEAQHGILVEFSPRVYAFSHPTFQEYYAARYVVERAEAGDEDAIPKLLAHANEDRWREVILLAVSKIHDVHTFFEVFLDRMDAMVRDDAKLVEFFAWAERKATSVDAPYKPAAVRAFYAVPNSGDARHLIIDLTCILAYDFTHTFNCGFNFDYACAISGAFELTSDIALCRVLIIALYCASDLIGLAGARGIAGDLARSFSRGLTSALDHALTLTQDIDGTELYTALSALKVPAANAPAETWRAFAERLQDIMIEHRNIGHDWAFTGEQRETLEAYFSAANLLVECLNVAYVTDCAAIEDRLVQPPSNTSEVP